MAAKKYERAVPDTSTVVNGILSKVLSSKELVVDELLIHQALLSELEHQANLGKESGFLGLNELKKLNDLEKKGILTIKYEGSRPTHIQIRGAKLGEIDASIRQLAWDLDAVLITSDAVQAEVAEAVGMKLLFYPYEVEEKEWPFVKYFKPDYMSVHLKEREPALAKAGVPGNWKFIKINKTPLKRDVLEKLTEDIVEIAKNDPDSFLEIERKGSIIAQLKNYRIVITRPPFSDGWEITLVRPIKKLSIDDYKLSDKLFSRIADKAEGILIAGAPGMGKSTFAQGLAEFYAGKEKVVKTLEAPRDLVLPDTITQFAVSRGTPQEIHDVLLLVRPDYTIFDEMRNTKDFELYADLRLSGVGMAGVIHATKTIDAIQRFIGRLELGLIAQVVDTVIFIENGAVSQVYELKMVVKVPTGMTEQDLARPVVEVSDFENGKLEYEIYTYGEETVVMPVATAKPKKTEFDILLEETLLNNLGRQLKVKPMDIEMVGPKTFKLYVPEDAISGVIGSGGQRIRSLEKMFGVSLDVIPIDQRVRNKAVSLRENEIIFKLRETKKFFTFYFKEYHKEVNLYLDGEFAGTFTIDKKGQLKLHKRSAVGTQITEALRVGKKIRFKL